MSKNWNWTGCKNILCIKADNMGDVIMSSPALKALKETFDAKITVLTSSMASGVTKYIPAIDETIIYNLPWVKATDDLQDRDFFEIVEKLKKYSFDSAVIFTVCSQNPLPAAMLAYLAGIPKILAYCRENPYHLINHWIPDSEPYSSIKHQVRRDLDLVAAVGAHTSDEKLNLNINCDLEGSIQGKFKEAGVDLTKPYIIFHPGVSEEKRQYPLEKWTEIGRRTIEKYQIPIIITGAESEKHLTDTLASNIGSGAYSLGGSLNLEEFILAIKEAAIVISVNTGTIHIAAAVNTPTLVLYALTNPQHLPWKCKGKAFLFDVPANLRSKNEVIKFMHSNLIPEKITDFGPEDVLQGIEEFLDKGLEEFPEMITLRNHQVFH